MKNNQTRLIKLLTALIVVFFLFFLKNELPGYLPKKSNQPFNLIKKDQISEIIFSKDKTATVYKRQNAWYVKNGNNEFKADEERINKIIEGFVNLKKENIVSTNQNKHRELGIDKQKIEFKTEGKSYLLYLGNTGGLSGNFVRIDNENVVFVSDGFDEAFTTDDYRDLFVHFIKDDTKINVVEINFDNEKITLKKDGKDWKIGNKKAKQDRVDFYLSDLKTLKADDIYSKDSFLPSSSTTGYIKIKENGKEKFIYFLPQNDNNYIAKTSNSEYIYQIPAAYIASLKKEEKDFLE